MQVRHTYFHGTKAVCSFFEGWYFKHQTDAHTLILIPAFHCDQRGRTSGSMQVILDDASHYVTFSPQDFEAETGRLHIRLGQSIFSEKGCRIHLDAPGLKLRGHLYYGSFQKPFRSFMGPFARLPLPCYHEVLSLFHNLRGRILVNGEIWDFSGGFGYLEKDWGHSFPDSYLWLQCSQKEQSRADSFLLTIAGLGDSAHPLKACSSLILHKGKQYRLSTWQGARLLRYNGRRIALRQGRYLLQVILPPGSGRSLSAEESTDSSVPLKAPLAGKLERTIQEKARCPMRCQLYRGGHKILDMQKEWGSLERV